MTDFTEAERATIQRLREGRRTLIERRTEERDRAFVEWRAYVALEREAWDRLNLADAALKKYYPRQCAPSRVEPPRPEPTLSPPNRTPPTKEPT
jgi:hypothetical protein